MQWYNCQKCGHLIQYGDSQCKECGAQIQWQPAQPAQQFTPQQQQTPTYVQEPEKKKSKTALIAVGILALLFIGTCSICLNSGSKSSSTTSSQTPITHESSSSSTSTQAPIEVQTYLSELLPINSDIGDELTNISTYSKNPQLTNTTWMNNYKSELYLLRGNINKIKAISAPPEMSDINSKYISGLDHIYTATDLILSGLNTLNANDINQATTEMGLGSTDITTAATMMQQYKAEHNY